MWQPARMVKSQAMEVGTRRCQIASAVAHTGTIPRFVASGVITCWAGGTSVRLVVGGNVSAARRVIARLLTIAVASTALIVGLAIDPPFAHAAVRHRTLNDTRRVGSAPVTPGHAIDYFGLVADLDSPSDGLVPQGATPYGEARFLVDGHWTPWQRLDQDGAQAAGQFTGSLIAVDHATGYQVRNLPQGARNWRAAAINTTDGPAEVLPRRGPTEAHAAVSCMSRADWGADETITAWSKGTDTQVFAPVQVVTVHHTAGSNDLNQDYSATMRAILSYHVTTQGWSDIAYQYLIDGYGKVYEGRNAGHTSKSCLDDGGDGSDFAHRTSDDQLVTGGHVYAMNGGNLGIALMGCYENGICTGDTIPPAPAVGSLTTLLTELAQRHSLDPQSTVHYVNPNPAYLNDATYYTKDISAISAHLNWSATACPGGNLYVQLPAIRTDVAQRVAASPVPVTLPAPTDLTATSSSTSIQINLTWTDKATDETGYRVERSTTDTFTAAVSVHLAAASTSYSDTGLNPNTTYWYRVTAYNKDESSSHSATAWVTTLAAPTAPTGLTAAATGKNVINLTWTDNANNESGFYIERCKGTTCTKFAQIASVGANTTTYANSGLGGGTTYKYRIRAHNAAGTSSYSNTASATTTKR